MFDPTANFREFQLERERQLRIEDAIRELARPRELNRFAGPQQQIRELNEYDLFLPGEDEQQPATAPQTQPGGDGGAPPTPPPGAPASAPGGQPGKGAAAGGLVDDYTINWSSPSSGAPAVRGADARSGGGGAD